LAPLDTIGYPQRLYLFKNTDMSYGTHGYNIGYYPDSMSATPATSSLDSTTKIVGTQSLKVENQATTGTGDITYIRRSIPIEDVQHLIGQRVWLYAILKTDGV